MSRVLDSKSCRRTYEWSCSLSVGGSRLARVPAANSPLAPLAGIWPSFSEDLAGGAPRTTEGAAASWRSLARRWVPSISPIRSEIHISSIACSRSMTVNCGAR
eukprot:scaffold2522_cov121-Isochrysis_galbana.AAC.4